MERIGEYVVRRMVGEGGMGKVYEAEERLSKRRVALKVLRPELTKSEECRRMFLNEMQILAHLEHPNVVRSLASCEVDGQLVMALEFLDGKTLRQELVERGRLPWPEAVRIVRAVAEGLAAAHANQPAVVHRDLKPENVMLPEGGAVKVTDFGVAKVLAAAHATNTQSVGTLQYMSPEQIDAREIDARSDLYSLGLVLYECLAGAPPFRSSSPRELLNQHCTQPAPELPEDVRATLPTGVEDVLFQMLEKSPDARPASATEIVTKLAPFAPTSSRAARTTPPTPTLVSTPQPPSSPRGERNDTVALVERSAQPRQILDAGSPHAHPRPVPRRGADGVRAAPAPRGGAGREWRSDSGAGPDRPAPVSDARARRHAARADVGATAPRGARPGCIHASGRGNARVAEASGGRAGAPWRHARAGLRALSRSRGGGVECLPHGFRRAQPAGRGAREHGRGAGGPRRRVSKRSWRAPSARPRCVRRRQDGAVRHGGGRGGVVHQLPRAREQSAGRHSALERARQSAHRASP